MNNLKEIKVFDVLAGTDITEAIEEALKIANENNCIVLFNFNGIEIKVYHFSNVKEEVNYYHRRLEEKMK
jgi:hypothetical protein